MSLEQTTCEDLKAFERRLTEVISCLRPITTRWRIVLTLSTICTAIGAWQWLNDPLTSQVTFTDSLMNHPFFTIASLVLLLCFKSFYKLSRGQMLKIIIMRFSQSHWLVLVKQVWQGSELLIFTSWNGYPNAGLLFLLGIHKRVIAPSIITHRTRQVLADFNMSCDETGKLILKPRPPNT